MTAHRRHFRKVEIVKVRNPRRCPRDQVKEVDAQATHEEEIRTQGRAFKKARAERIEQAHKDHQPAITTREQLIAAGLIKV